MMWVGSVFSCCDDGVEGGFTGAVLFEVVVYFCCECGFCGVGVLVNNVGYAFCYGVSDAACFFDVVYFFVVFDHPCFVDGVADVDDCAVGGVFL